MKWNEMKFPSPIILIMSYTTLCVNFMLLLLSTDYIFIPKVSPLKCKFLPKFGPEILPKCFRCLVWFISIIKMDFNNIFKQVYSWNRHFCSPNNHQDGSLQVCHVSYCSLWALIKGQFFSKFTVVCLDNLHLFRCIFATIYLSMRGWYFDINFVAFCSRMAENVGDCMPILEKLISLSDKPATPAVENNGSKNNSNAKGMLHQSLGLSWNATFFSDCTKSMFSRLSSLLSSAVFLRIFFIRLTKSVNGVLVSFGPRRKLAKPDTSALLFAFAELLDEFSPFLDEVGNMPLALELFLEPLFSTARWSR